MKVTDKIHVQHFCECERFGAETEQAYMVSDLIKMMDEADSWDDHPVLSEDDLNWYASDIILSLADKLHLEISSYETYGDLKDDILDLLHPENNQ